MKALMHQRYGPPEVVRLTETQKPVPGPDEVLIKVYAATVNRTDCGFRSAEYFVSRLFSGLFRPKHKILGNEFAGVIESVGSAVHTYKAGDSVFGYNDKQFGAHAEFMIMPANGAMALKPKNLSFEESACLTEGAHYALCDIRAARVKAGDPVLVYGASGAIGSAAVQLLKQIGAYVVAVCNTKNMDKVRALGADLVIDYTKEDFTKTPQRFTFIFDAVGKSSFGECKPLLKEKGIYISTELGYRGENILLALTTPLFGKKKLLFPIPSISREDVLFFKELAESGKFKPLIDRYYKPEEITEAYTYVESGQKSGNVVLKFVSA